MFPFVAEAIRRFNEAGLPVIVITNQSGVGRGFFPESLVGAIHELMIQQLAALGAHLEAIYYCPHTSADGCDCRKPKLGMLERAAREHRLDLRRSFVAGDRYVDIDSLIVPALGAYWFAQATEKGSVLGMQLSGPGSRTLSQRISPEPLNGF